MTERYEGAAWPLIDELAGRCRRAADLAELKVRAHQLAELAAAGEVWVVRGREGRLLAIGGAVRIGNRLAELWGIVADDLDRWEGYALARLLTGWAKLYLQVHKLQRIQATAATRHAEAVKLLEVMGLRREGVLRRYGLAGEAHAMYAMTDEDWLVGEVPGARAPGSCQNPSPGPAGHPLPQGEREATNAAGCGVSRAVRRGPQGASHGH